ncbi:DUF418 domain-containing protein [Parasedimentitalea marina]|uniref:DUF418 domain-containing protein n=1 Tax=Parasedimentitalea marina TaxID=2483033 RepID=A0A3T0MZM0_9RHOB|nr:DUF418 domain-containing protein [Parasedimentitalea marina]
MRLQGLDIVRFLAFCGMVLVNFRLAAQVTPGDDWPSLLTTALEGRAAALFVVLAGIGVALAKAPASLMLRRVAFLFVLGLANLTIFEADILHFYALYFAAAIPFVSAPNRWLWAGIAVVMALSLCAQLILNYEAGWNWDTLHYADFWTISGFLRHALYNGWHPVFPWLSFLLFGMWIGRLALSTKGVQLHLAIWGTVAAALALIPGWLIDDPEVIDLINTTSIPPGPFYIIAGCGSAAAVIGLILLLHPILNRLRMAQWLAPAGRQSLTLYAAHILLGMGTLEALGWLDGSLTAPQILWISLVFCLACLIYTCLWGLKFKRGPLEMMMRRLTEIGR